MKTGKQKCLRERELFPPPPPFSGRAFHSEQEGLGSFQCVQNTSSHPGFLLSFASPSLKISACVTRQSLLYESITQAGAGPGSLLRKSFLASPVQIHHPSIPQEGGGRRSGGATPTRRNWAVRGSDPPHPTSGPPRPGSTIHRAPRAARSRPGAQGRGPGRAEPSTRVRGAGRPPPYLLLAVVDAHSALLDHQRLVDLQEAAGPHEAVHGRRRAGLCRSPVLPGCERRPLVAGGGGAAGRESLPPPNPDLRQA